MNFFEQDMKTNIPSKGGERILSHITCDSALSHERKNKEQGPKSKLEEKKPKVGDKGVQEQIMF
jgi:hypothetical protein